LIAFAALGLFAMSAVGCNRRADSTHGTHADRAASPFEAPLRAYLDKRGDLCLNKTKWPIDVPLNAAPNDRDALQMPVFERLGLVRSSSATVDSKAGDKVVPVDVRRYELTDAGRARYIQRERGRGPTGEPIYESDLCVARLSLDRIVRADVIEHDAGARDATVAYTYHVEAPAWTHDAEVQRVLPMVAHVVNGEGTAQLTETFIWTRDGWVARELVGGEQAPK